MAFTFSRRAKAQKTNKQTLDSKALNSKALESRALESTKKEKEPESFDTQNASCKATKDQNKNSSHLNLLQIYYGSGELEKLQSYKYVAIQPAYYSNTEIKTLKASGVIPLAYISLGEDSKDYVDIEKPYRRKRMNVDWQTYYVYVGSTEWQEKIQSLVKEYINRGFQGFLLDSLDVIDLFPEDRSAMLQLINYIHQELGLLKKQSKVSTYLLANRGFSLFPEMASLIDANLFEGFSNRWTLDGKNEVMSTKDLHWSALKARELEQYNLDKYSLDYCISDNKVELEHFAIERAKYYGFTPLISNRALTEI